MGACNSTGCGCEKWLGKRNRGLGFEFLKSRYFRGPPPTLNIEPGEAKAAGSGQGCFFGTYLVSFVHLLMHGVLLL